LYPKKGETTQKRRDEGLDKYARCFVRGSLIYLAIGVIMGVMMAANGDWTPLLGRVHNHINLVGFVSFILTKPSPLI